jgi:gamma-glutamyltranspeptidase/glutathione hydrolase
MSGIVVCVDQRAADEAARVLEAGGNAFDAAVAAAFVQMVVMPFSCGVGGMASAHLWKAESAQHVVIDGLLRAGSLATADMWAADYMGEAEFSGSSLFEDYRSTIGYTSICTPGAVASLGELHRLFGSLPWKDLLRPAADIAQSGFHFEPITTAALTEDPGPYQPDQVTRLKATPECARLYYREPATNASGKRKFRNPDYAEILARLADRGARDFYEGELGNAIARDLRRNGSFVTADDLRTYAPKAYLPMVVSYRDYDVWSNVSPGGGPLLLDALAVIDGMDSAGLEHSGPERLAWVAATLQLVNQDRLDLLGDPDHIGYEVHQTFVSKERAARLRDRVLSGEIGAEPPPADSPDTTHLTVVDADGNVAAITHSNGQHSGVVTPGLGFVYNNGMNRFDPRPGRPSSLAPGKARLHLMMPSIAFEDSRPAIVLGAPGGNAILSALVQTLSNVVDFGMAPADAVSATRIHAEGSTIWCESRLSDATVDGLAARDFTVVQHPEPFAPRMAWAQLVLIGRDGTLTGASDPRGAAGVAYAR